MFIPLTTKIGMTTTPIHVNLAQVCYIRESTATNAPGCFLHFFPDTSAQPVFVVETPEAIFRKAHL